MYLEDIIEDVQLESDRFEAKSILNKDDVMGGLRQSQDLQMQPAVSSISVLRIRPISLLVLTG